MARPDEHMVIGLYDPAEPDTLRYVSVERRGHDRWWKAVWHARDQVSTPLAMWFRTLAAAGREPAETVLLGRAGVGRRVALAAARALGGEQGPAGHCRPVTVVGVGRYESVSAAARALRVSRVNLSRAITAGRPYRGWTICSN
jgi:hypothetical protein